jgi:hypothetical protein
VAWTAETATDGKTADTVSTYAYSTETYDVGEPYIASSADKVSDGVANGNPYNIVLPINHPLFSKMDFPTAGLTDLRYEIEFENPNAIAIDINAAAYDDTDIENLKAFEYALSGCKLEIPYWKYDDDADRREFNDALLANGRSWMIPWYSVITGHSTTAGQTDENIDITERISSAKSLIISMRYSLGLTSTGFRNLTQRFHNNLKYLYLVAANGRQIPFEKQDVSSAYRIITKNKDIVTKQNDVSWASRLNATIVSTTDPTCASATQSNDNMEEMHVDFMLDLTRYSEDQRGVIVGTALQQGAYIRLEFGDGGATSASDISVFINYDALVRRNPAGQGQSFEIKKFFTPIDYLS